MGDKAKHEHDLRELLTGYLKTKNDQKLINYILDNSNLPSPRANLELAFALSNILHEFNSREIITLWKFFTQQLNLSKFDAPVDDPREFLPFCSVYGLGSIMANHRHYFEKGIKLLKYAASDFRWRVRESVPHILTKLIVKYGDAALDIILPWIHETNWLLTRAVITCLADYKLLNNPAIAQKALDVHYEMTGKILGEKNRRDSKFLVARKALGFTLGIVILASPDRGFELMDSWILIDDADLDWIIKQNLKKNRLKSRFHNKLEDYWKQIKRARH